MSKGFGAVQRRILAQLAVAPTDPVAEGWTAMRDLARPADAESKRRALRGLAAAGLVQTVLLRPITMAPLFRDGDFVRGDDGRAILFPTRNRGVRQLHARLTPPASPAG